MQGEAVFAGINADGANAQFACGTHDADGDFGTVGDEEAADGFHGGRDGHGVGTIRSGREGDAGFRFGAEYRIKIPLIEMLKNKSSISAAWLPGRRFRSTTTTRLVLSRLGLAGRAWLN